MNSKKGIGHRPKRKLEVYKDQIAEWLEQGLNVTDVVRRLQSELGADIGQSTLGRRLKEWGLYHRTARKGWVQNLDKHKAQLLEWDDEGFTAEDMAARLRPEYQALLSAVTIQRALKRWKQSNPLTWRSFNTGPSENILLESPGPADLLSEDELELLSQGIMEAYQRHPNEFENPRDDLESHWTEILVHAACHDEAIQLSLIRERLQPGHHWDNDCQFNPLWILGIQLPGSYKEELVDTQDKVMWLVKSITPAVLGRVRSTVLPMIEDSVSLAVREEGGEYVKTALEAIPATAPPECMVKLMQFARYDIRERHLNYGLRRSLEGLRASDSPACASLLEHLKKGCGVPSLLERFTSVAQRGLRTWQQPDMTLQELAPLGPVEMESVERDEHLWSRAITLPVPAKQKSEGIHDEDNSFLAGDSGPGLESADESDYEAEIEDAANGHVFTQSAQQGRLYKLLSDRIKKRVPQPLVFNDWRSPTSGALLGRSRVRFGSPAWDYCVAGQLKTNKAEGATQGGIEGIMNSFADGHRASKAEFLSLAYPEPETIFWDAVRHLNMTFTSQSAKEKDEYGKICRRMCGCVAPPPGADALSSKDFGWSSTVRDDDWWHCRRLLQMIAARYGISSHDYSAYELRMMMILAAVEGGSTEPLPWLIALDGVLQALTRQVLGFEVATAQEGSLRDRLIMELVNFSHATALNNIVLRFASTRTRENPGNAPWTLQKWYTMIYQLEPQCADLSCLRLLPSPRSVTSHTVNKLFSVGTRDCRVGCPRARSFISQNRWYAYPCFVSWMREREPHPVLICAFVWYAGIFHTDSSCRAGRGKQTFNF